MKTFYFILLAILEPWVECCLHLFLDFLRNEFLERQQQ